MYTLYDFLNKFKFEDFEIVSRDGKEMLSTHKVCHSDINDALEYQDTKEEKYLADLCEYAVCKVDFEQMVVYIDR